MFSKPADDELEVALLGRGFGESIVIHCGDGIYAVIDSLIDNEGESAPLSYLRSCGADLGKVARIIATHWHDDHVDGISDLYAACQNAGLVLPLVLNEAEFQGFVRKKGRTGTSRVSSGVQQLVSLLEIKRLENRSPANFAHAATTIYRKAHERFPVVITALSPCAEDIDRFLGNIGRQMVNDPGDIRAYPINPNDVSVALLAEIGSHSILLGADLINLTDSTRGWKAVVSSLDRPQVRSQVFKVPHHGAENAHNADVRTSMLVEKPISILAPFNHGVGVPKASDVA